MALPYSAVSKGKGFVQSCRAAQGTSRDDIMALQRKKLRKTHDSLFKKALPFVLIMLAAWSLHATPRAAYATEGGGSTYPIGVNTVLPAIMPGLGKTELLNYLADIPLTSLNDSHGRHSPEAFGGNLFAFAPRLLHTWNFALGDFHFSTGLSPVFQRKYVSVGGQNSYTFNMSSFDMKALYVTWSKGDLHLLFGQDFWFPGSSYNHSDFSNVTATRVTFMEEGAVTWTPGNWEFSLENTVQMSTRNRDTGYHDGTLFNMDYGISYRPFPKLRKLQFGVNGNWAYQTSNDTLNGQRYMDGYKLRNFTIGPQIVYDFSPGTAVVLKWQHALDARNTIGGDRYWVEFALPIHLFD